MSTRPPSIVALQVLGYLVVYALGGAFGLAVAAMAAGFVFWSGWEVRPMLSGAGIFAGLVCYGYAWAILGRVKWSRRRGPEPETPRAVSTSFPEHLELRK